MATAVLALQGDFAEHARMLRLLGEPTFELRDASDLARPFDRLVLPGGESTVQGRLLRELGLVEPLRERIAAGMPVLATCAGLILLAERVTGDGSRTAATRADQTGPWLATLDVEVERNAYGRQLGSFHAEGILRAPATQHGGRTPDPARDAFLHQRIPMTFIRAPRIVAVGPRAQVLAYVDSTIVGVQQNNQLALAFHPELDQNPAVYELFLSL